MRAEGCDHYHDDVLRALGEQPFHSLHIHYVFLGTGARCFHDEAHILQCRLVQEVVHTFTDTALTNMPVPVPVRPELSLGVVKVDELETP